ncbi:MAG: hypothetical protein AB7I30_07075, partial [Isosphaeraceae bacterium]
MNPLVTIRRKRFDREPIRGVIVGRSATLTMLHKTIDFQFDGFVVVRDQDVSERESGESDMAFRRIMRGEGLWETAPRWVKRLPIEDWPGLLSRFVGSVVILEDESRGEFWIGRVVEVLSKHASIHYFDVCGRLRNVEKVPYRQITRME